MGRGQGKVNDPGITDEYIRTISLSGDKFGHLNLTMHGHTQEKRTPHTPRYTVARIRTYETVCALGIEDTSLSWNEEWFGPRYRLESNMEDMNGSLEQVWINALEHLRELVSAPSVGMHDVPRESLLEHLGFGKESDTQDKLDERLARHTRFVHKLQEPDTASSSSDEEP
ncbi:hypothetical protein EDD85DRAFT_938975 [Armillaria nabsnona]|nr:hypothetical protein EDD85DRAFT_938975 [Armillaria nabsnona]